MSFSFQFFSKGMNSHVQEAFFSFRDPVIILHQPRRQACGVFLRSNETYPDIKAGTQLQHTLRSSIFLTEILLGVTLLSGSVLKITRRGFQLLGRKRRVTCCRVCRIEKRQKERPAQQKIAYVLSLMNQNVVSKPNRKSSLF